MWISPHYASSGRLDDRQMVIWLVYAVASFAAPPVHASNAFLFEPTLSIRGTQRSSIVHNLEIAAEHTFIVSRNYVEAHNTSSDVIAAREAGLYAGEEKRKGMFVFRGKFGYWNGQSDSELLHLAQEAIREGLEKKKPKRQVSTRTW